ncbi:L-aspartate oxidase [Demetria terragena]|uniref:L-aspartate oxidase n=1 Tax=Demetria terragena TaxID=63959 RepID=UPI00037387CE|nr:FAD-binding protein [Demetria terragena]
MRPVVIGSGLAGLTAALDIAAERDCVLVTAGDLTDGTASKWAQGGIAAALSEEDSPAHHARDTWRAGAEYGDPTAIARITAAAPEVVASLAALGVVFDRRPSGAYDLALEGGHGHHRIAHAGDRTGEAITLAVARHVADHPRIEVHPHDKATRLHLRDGHICGVTIEGACGSVLLETDSVVLATGGLGALYPHTTNPLGAVGSGIALAARVGARIDDLHLVQFHPTALDVGADPAPLLTEALRGAGALLRSDGKRFVDELQPRDVVAAAVWDQLERGRQVHLDATQIPEVESRFPAVTALLASHGLSLHQPLPIRPAAHYAMGGVTVDESARSTVPGLYAVGEVGRTGLHGANRLASNSLLEAVVTGRAAGRSIRSGERSQGIDLPAADPAQMTAHGTAAMDRAEVRSILGKTCGVLRDRDGLSSAVARLAAAVDQDDAYVAWLLARSALAHPMSVGAHRRTDEPALQEATS